MAYIVLTVASLSPCSTAMLINETTGQIPRQQTAICLQQDVQENFNYISTHLRSLRFACLGNSLHEICVKEEMYLYSNNLCILSSVFEWLNIL